LTAYQQTKEIIWLYILRRDLILRRIMLKKFSIIIWLIAILVLISSAASATAKKKHSGIFSLKVGYTGTVKTESFGSTTELFKGALSGGFALEFPIFNNDWLTGCAVDFYKPKQEGASYFDNDDWFLNFLWCLKGNIGHRKNGLIIRPGFGIGYGSYIYRLFKTSPMSPYQFTTLQATTEIIIGAKGQSAFLIEFGVFCAPLGDNEHGDYEIKPLPLVRLGLQFL
jgi:hypothetical protein